MSITKLIKECANRNYAKASKLFESELEQKVCEILGSDKEDILALDELEDGAEEPVAEGDEEKKDEPVAEGEEDKEESVAEDVDAKGDDVEKSLHEAEEDEEVKTESEGDEEEVKAEGEELDFVVEDDFEKIAESVLFGKRN